MSRVQNSAKVRIRMILIGEQVGATSFDYSAFPVVSSCSLFWGRDATSSQAPAPFPSSGFSASVPLQGYGHCQPQEYKRLLASPRGLALPALRWCWLEELGCSFVRLVVVNGSTPPRGKSFIFFSSGCFLSVGHHRYGPRL